MRYFSLSLVVLSLAAPAQSRRDDFDPAAVVVNTTQLEQLEDGGCSVRWCGEILSEDAGTRLRACTDLVEIRQATNRTRCTALVTAGAGRVLRELRFAVDAGAP